MVELSEPRSFVTGVEHGPAILPGPPARWSYSTLKEVETCPRRYALSRADYPNLWESHGYPRLPNPAAIKGDVVHGALDIIVKALVKAGCSSTRSADAVAVLRGLGGYTAVADGVLQTQLAAFKGNPRISDDRRAQLTRSLTDWIPEARGQIQTYLNRMELQPAVSSGSGKSTASSDPSKRYPARPGDHPEKELVAESLRLHGRLDLLSVSTEGAAITDFKTGNEDPAHHDQLRLYALLWISDSEANPDGLGVTALVAAYPSHDVAVAVPSRDELDSLGGELRTRIEAAETAIRAEVPVALPGEHCGLCTVRGLCAEYWATVPATARVADGTWYDLRGTVVREHGVKSFVLHEAPSGREVLVRTPTPSYSLPLGEDVRIISARRIVDPDEEDALIAALALVSEVYRLTD